MAGITRAPHGSPEFTTLLAFRGTPDHKRKVQRAGGSAYLRSLIDRQRQHEEVIRRARAVLDALQHIEYDSGTSEIVNQLQTAIRKVQA